MSVERVQVAVVGSGPGGAVAAALLAQAGKSVLILEEGPGLGQDSDPAFSAEELLAKCRGGGVTPALGPTPIAYVEGRVLGGGSEVNSGLYHRAPEEALARWREERRVEGLSSKDLAPHFDACEAVVRPGVERADSPPGARLARGAAALGLECAEVARMASAAAGPVERRSMSRTFLPLARSAGARVATDTRVARLRRSGGAWVLDTAAGPAAEAETVVLACGAIQTPALLARSGLGSGTGALRLHPMLKVVAEFGEPVNRPGLGVPAQQVHGPEYSFGCSISAPGHLALALGGAHPAAAVADWTRFAAYYVTIEAEGEGSVGLVPGFRDPLVRFALAPRDRSRLGAGLKALAKLLLAGGAERVFAPLEGSSALESAAAADRLPDSLPEGTSLSSLHLFATCPMGEAAGLPADSLGRLRAAPGIVVADSSALCGTLGVNPQGTVMAVARRNAAALAGA